MTDMDVRLSPEIQARLDELARTSGRTSEELAGEAIAGYLDEFAQLREMLDQRYDDLESGRVKLIDGEEAYRRLMESSEARRRRPA